METKNTECGIEGLADRLSREVREYDIALLDDNEHNHFSRMEGERKEEFVESIRRYGVLTPLIIRPREARYEILAGHNRKYGALEAGLATVPCIALDLDDVDATVVIGVTNHQREQTTDLEWGWTYRTTLEAVMASGSRNAGERSVETVAGKYGASPRTVQRKIRLTYLVPQLYQYCLREKIPQNVMVSLSYLDRITQINVVQAAVIEGTALSAELALSIRQEAEKCRREGGELTINGILCLCRKMTPESGNRTRGRRYEVREELFPEGLIYAERQDYIEKALLYVRDSGTVL